MLSRGYQPIPEESEENPEEGEIDQEGTEKDSIIRRGDNLPTICLNKYNTDGKEPKHNQINHTVGNLTANTKMTEEKN